MDIELNSKGENAPKYLKEIWEQIKTEVAPYSGVQDSEGRLLSHNAYVYASIGYDKNSTCIELRAKNNDRLLATYVISPCLSPIGFIGNNGKLITFFP